MKQPECSRLMTSKFWRHGLPVAKILLNGLQKEATRHVQSDRERAAQVFVKNKCWNCQWSQTVPASADHQATVHSQRWTPPPFRRGLCPCEPWQPASIILQVGVSATLIPRLQWNSPWQIVYIMLHVELIPCFLYISAFMLKILMLPTPDQVQERASPPWNT